MGEKKYKAVIFDLDGTFYDNSCLMWMLPLAELCYGKLGFLARERRCRKQLRTQHYGTEENFYDQLYRAISAKHPDRARRWYHLHYLPMQVRIIRHFCKPYPWVKPRLEALREQGVLVALYSDYGRPEDKLLALGLDPGMFDLIVNAPSLGGLKPNVENARAILSLLQVAPADALFVGDRDDCDGETARRVGSDFELQGKQSTENSNKPKS